MKQLTSGITIASLEKVQLIHLPVVNAAIVVPGHFDIILMGVYMRICVMEAGQWQGQVISSHIYCGMKLFVSALHTCVLRTNPHIMKAGFAFMNMWFVILIASGTFLKSNPNKTKENKQNTKYEVISPEGKIKHDFGAPCEMRWFICLVHCDFSGIN